MKGTGPSEDWLKFVKTNQAKSKIRAYFMRKEVEKKEEKVPVGEKVLSDELRKRGFNPDEYMDKKKLESIFSQFSVNNYTDLMYGLASKIINPVSVCEKLTNQKRSISDQELNKIINHETKRKPTSKIGVFVPGVESMKMSIAQCCLPVYGDEITGYISQGEGVKVHRSDCRNVKVKGARLIHVEWEQEDPDKLYDCNLTILSHDRNFLVTDLVTTVSQSKAPMVKLNASVNQETLLSTIKMTIQIHNLEQLRTLLANIRKVDSVISVERDN